MVLGSNQNICKLYLDCVENAFCEIIDTYKIVKIGGVLNDRYENELKLI